MTNTYEVRLTGWKRGMRTVSLIQLIRESTRMSLQGAKQVVDDLLAGQAHTFTLAQRGDAAAFRKAAARLGAETD